MSVYFIDEMLRCPIHSYRWMGIILHQICLWLFSSHPSYPEVLHSILVLLKNYTKAAENPEIVSFIYQLASIIIIFLFMYFRKPQPSPSTTVLQVTGQLTIHHTQPTQQLFQPNYQQHSRQQYKMHQMQQARENSLESKAKNQRFHYEQFDFRKEGRAYGRQSPPQEQQEAKEDEQKQKHPIMKENTEQETQKKKMQGERDEKISSHTAQKRKQPKPSNIQPFETRKLSGLEALKELGQRLHQMEEAWEISMGACNFQFLYQLREIRQSLESQTTSLLLQLDQRMQPFRKAASQWSQELEKEKSLLKKEMTKERQEWKKEKEQLVKEMEGIMEEMLEGERQQAEKVIDEKFSCFNTILQKQLEAGKVCIEEKVQNVEERLHIKVKQEISRHEKFENHFEAMSKKLNILFDEATPIFQSSRLQEVVQKQKMEKENEEKEKMERLEKMLDKSTPYVDNFTFHHNTATLHKEIKNDTDNRFYQMLLLDRKIGGETFSFLIHMKQMKGGYAWVGVTDKVSQGNRQWPEDPHSVIYAGYKGEIRFGSGELDKPESQSEQTHDILSEGMDVVVEVDRKECTVVFTLKGVSKKNNEPIDGVRVYNVHSPILSQPTRQFVPFFAICRQGQSISYEVK